MKLPIDIAHIRLDLNGDGKVADEERFWYILGLVDPRARGVKSDTFVVAFDTGDAMAPRLYASPDRHR